MFVVNTGKRWKQKFFKKIILCIFTYTRARFLSFKTTQMLYFFKKFLADTELIAGIKHTNTYSRRFETQLFEKYQFHIKEGVRKHRLSEDECVSIYSDTIIAIIENIRKDKFEGRSELKTYIYQVFNNKCVDQIRKNTTNKASVYDAISYEDIEIPLPDDSKTIIQKLLINSELEKLYQKLNSIGEKCKQIILLWGEGYSDEEIAQQLNYHTAAVSKTSRLRCLEKLKENY
ncbi:RNA polymerase sigma factor [Emticicia oligotrophica]|nr:RNA polymerase sigma factor [Emticicia oligotrophica]